MDNLYKAKVKKIVQQAKKEGKIKTYSEFCRTEVAKKYRLSEEEIQYYTSKNKKETWMRKFKIGEVAQINLERFLNTYIKYIESN